MSNNNHSFFILCIAIVLLIIISIVPISDTFNGKLKSFNLFNDILITEEPNYNNTTNTDSKLDQKLIAIIDSIDDTNDSIQNQQVIRTNPNNPTNSNITTSDSLFNPRQGNIVVIEDYSTNKTAFLNLQNALANRSTLGRPVRIAFLGDSYIEGDIFSQHVREQLQNIYGGAGVGYVNMHSDFPGFRRSVKQRSKGWSVYDFIKNNISDSCLTITQQYFKPESNATSKYTGTNYAKHLDKWDSSKFVFISSTETEIQVKTDKDWISHNVKNSDSIQYIEIHKTTSEFSVKASSPDFIGIGVWLESTEGITVDCMSTRGSSGTTLTRINANLAKQMSQIIQYDLIILEYGINAMTSGQTNFNAYTSQIEKVIAHLRSCYPNTDILLMGIGDRGEKYGNEIHSMKNAQLMVNAQRKLAQKMGCAFWDTREAMGGDDAIIKWANHTPAYANKDYIHLSYKGGEILATEFVKSLQHALNE